MAKPNYAFAKRQRDLAKKQKKEEKRLRKAAAIEEQAPEDAQAPQIEDDKAPE
jgi:hypothetical protein